MKILAKNLQDIEACAHRFIETLAAEGAGATIIALYGNLGAGKTTFTQAVARVLGVEETVTSPTFVIEKIYKITHPAFDKLIHIDAYRLDSGHELMTLGWKELIENPKNLIMLEWPERVAEILPESIKKLYFTFIDESTREIVVE